MAKHALQSEYIKTSYGQRVLHGCDSVSVDADRDQRTCPTSALKRDCLAPKAFSTHLSFEDEVGWYAAAQVISSERTAKLPYLEIGSKRFFIGAIKRVTTKLPRRFAQ